MKIKEDVKQKFAAAMVNLAQAMKKETEKCAEMCGVVSEKELSIILFVGQNKNVKMSDIAGTIEAPMSTLTSIADKLVEKKLLNRDHSGEDRRVINVSLTPTGKTAYNKIVEKKFKVAEAILSKLDGKEQGLILKHLEHIVREMAGRV